MFANGAAFGGDLISTDIFRGREHGLPSYNEYRQVCGLGKVSSWSGFSDLISARVSEGRKEDKTRSLCFENKR